MGDFRLTPLDATVMDEDYEAVTGSAHVLKGVFGNDWPMGLTRQDNLTDLHWHDREFTLRRSFSWVVRDLEDSYLGCAYVFPDPGAGGTAQVYTWIRDRPDRRELNKRLNAALADWFADMLPGDLTLRWRNPD
ncbi:MAG: GNAT family N-acetyltransferase [Pseudomonadota bacterium]